MIKYTAIPSIAIPTVLSRQYWKKNYSPYVRANTAYKLLFFELSLIYAWSIHVTHCFCPYKVGGEISWKTGTLCDNVGIACFPQPFATSHIKQHCLHEVSLLVPRYVCLSQCHVTLSRQVIPWGGDKKFPSLVHYCVKKNPLLDPILPTICSRLI